MALADCCVAIRLRGAATTRWRAGRRNEPLRTASCPQQEFETETKLWPNSKILNRNPARRSVSYSSSC